MEQSGFTKIGNPINRKSHTPTHTMPQKNIRDIAAPLHDRIFYLNPRDAEPAAELIAGKKERFNVRDDMGDIHEFAESLRPGIKLPLLGYMGENGKFQITDGERRWKAARILLARNVEIKLPVQLEPKGTTAEERNIGLLVTATGKPLEIIEQARVIERLLDGLAGKALARKLKELPKKIGKSATHIANCLALLDAPEAIKAAVGKGEMSGTLAAELAKAVPDKKKQVEVLEEARGKAKAKGKTKVTAKLLSVKTGKKAQAARKSGGQKPEVGGQPVLGPARPPRDQTDTEDATLGKLLDLLHSVERRDAETERYETLEILIDYLSGKETRKALTEFLLGIR